MSDQEDTPTPRKLSYDPAKLPNPMGATEHYAHASLIELRALRSVLTRIADALEAQNAPADPDPITNAAMQPKAAKAK